MITIRRNHLATAFVLIAAIASIPSLASAAADGALDTTFGTGGKVTTTIGGGDQGKAIAIQSNGKILVVGDDSNDFKVVRYNTDGSLDTSFDSDGKVTTDINGGFDDGQSVAIQSDGKIVVAGMGRVGLNENFAVVRYNTDGSLDTTFDTDGKATTDIGTSTRDKANAVVIQSDGKIIAAGTSNNDFAIARYTATGALDTTFDTDGKATTDIGTSTTDTANAVAIQSDGKIIAAGTSNNDFAIARYTATGALDTTFDTDGKATTDIGTSTTDTANAVAIQSDGKIIAAGTSNNDFAVARYTSTGALDTSLDTDGKATTDIGTSTSDAANAVAIQSDGKIIAAGTSNDDFAVARYTTTGALDTSLDTDGKVTTDIGTGTFDAGNAMAIQGDSKIVVAGQSSASGPPSFAVARYEVADISTSSSSSSSSTSTTVAATTTTVAAATTTTVAAAEVTTTTVAATTTTVAATTTTVAAATTTTTNAVVKRTATAASDKTSTTLPATGSNSSIPGIIGATLVVVGLVLVTRRRLVN
jgi:uncharacterized delta-60 repeat protein/LPXTG-motif cell wall-anchored protein